MSLPATSAELLDWGWDDYAPHYEALASAELDAASVGDWLQQWSDLVELLSEVGTRMHIATTVDTTDTEARDAYHKFLEQVGEPAQAAEQRLKQHLLASGLEPDDFGVQLRAMRSEAEAGYVTMLRPVTEVVGSKQRVYDARTSEVHRTAAWVNMMLHVERSTRGSSRAFVRYHDMLDDWTVPVFGLGQRFDLGCEGRDARTQSVLLADRPGQPDGDFFLT